MASILAPGLYIIFPSREDAVKILKLSPVTVATTATDSHRFPF